MIIKLITSVGDVINSDPDICGRLKVQSCVFTSRGGAEEWQHGCLLFRVDAVQ